MRLLDACIKGSKAKGKKGLIILSSAQKRPYLAEAKFLQYKEVRVADQMNPYFDLMYLPFEMGVPIWTFKGDLKRGKIQDLFCIIHHSSRLPQGMYQ